MDQLLPVELIELILNSSASSALVKKVQGSYNQNIGSLPILEEVVQPIRGFAKRHRIDQNHELSESLLFTLSRILNISKEDKEGVLRPRLLPDILQFLLGLVEVPSSTTLKLAHDILWDRDHPIPPVKPPNLRDILGDDWEEQIPLSPYVSESESEEETQLSSSSSLSTLSDAGPITPMKTKRIPTKSNSTPYFTQLTPDEDGLRALQLRQYWKVEVTEESVDLLGVPSKKSNWKEVDVVREVLRALQSRIGAGLFERGINGLQVSSSAPVMSDLPTSNFYSLLSTFTPSINALATLREFAQNTLNQATPTSISNSTIQAFALALESYLQLYTKWCVDQEIELLSSKKEIVISLLRLSDSVGLRFRALNTLVQAIQTLDSKLSSQENIARLLDFLGDAVEKAFESGQIEAGKSLRTIFVCAFEPLWLEVGDWITKGRLRIEESETKEGEGSFFIRRIEGSDENQLDIFNKSFELWSSSTASDENQDKKKKSNSVPKVLEGIVLDILECGKSVHLLRNVIQEGDWLESITEWPTIASLVGLNPVVEAGVVEVLSNQEVVRRALFSVPSFTKESITSASIPTSTLASNSFSQFLIDEIFEICQPLFVVAHFKLHRIFKEDCKLDYHLSAIQGIFLMRNGWEIGTFLTSVFEKMDRGLGSVWSDFQLLNTAWTRAIGKATWTDVGSLRLRLKPSRGSKYSSRSVKVFNNLQIEYNVPSPLGFIFSPSTMIIYTQIFTFLIQIRRAKHLLDRLTLIKIVNSIVPALRQSEVDIKRYYNLRRKLLFVVYTFFEFFMEFVIGKEIEAFEKVLKNSSTVNEMIDGHQIHAFKLRDRLLLNSTTEPIHGAILSILDLCVSLSDIWSTLNSDTSLNDTPTNRSFSKISRRRRSYRRRSSRHDSDSNSDDSDDEEVEQEQGEGEEDDTFNARNGGTSASYVSFQDENFTKRIEKIEEELENLIGFIRRGIEGLKSSPSKEVRDLFSILSSNLDEWK